ncbi:hypothetical protein CCACVL1_24395 [Corchorus capsularis]|uniref:HAT C-terminal dimerisation domain-containing protein n=1 Tax=Corchorus capsularis TaxID=210143 RepID=A0A1R3GPY5_COCAP|nr:hypothetical protein CCACVL1_24395 [Corchorus capsularis]
MMETSFGKGTNEMGSMESILEGHGDRIDGKRRGPIKIHGVRERVREVKMRTIESLSCELVTVAQKEISVQFSKIHGPSCDVEVERIDKICRDLFREYEKKFTDTVVERNNSDIPGVNLDGYDEFIRKEYKKTEVRSEFDYYLEEDVWPRSPDFDILEWWQSYGLEYPMLRRIARDIYAVPVFTKASESTFDSSLCLELTDEE